jgi:ADP-ribose pyrophosphatase YjhB (NUDIX family)
MKMGLEAREEFTGKRLKIYKAKPLAPDYLNKKGGKLFKSGKRLLARCDVGWLEILECQLEGKQKLSAREYLFLPQSSTASARGIVVHENKILLIYRNKYGNIYYSTPGGAIDVGETAEEAVICEVKEETNLNVEVVEKAFEGVGRGIEKIYSHIHFLCKPVGDINDIRLVGEETEYDQTQNFYEPRWIDIDEVQYLDIDENVKEYVKKYKAQSTKSKD